MTLPRLPKRSADSNKGDHGKILIVAGSRGMTGAAVLASEAAYRTGAGLVHLAVPDSQVPVVCSRQTCAVVHGLPDDHGVIGKGASDRVLSLLDGLDILAIGPGLGAAGEEIRQIVHASPKPMVIDADALNAFAEHPELLGRGNAPRVYTPHPGELSRLAKISVDTIQGDRVVHAEEAARRHLGIVVLKGHGTVVTDGKRTFINKTGNPGMATGGTGDVLTGVIAALMGQKLDPFDAARLGVHLHGLAGDLAAKKIGQVSLMATDLLDFLPDAIRKGGKK